MHVLKPHPPQFCTSLASAGDVLARNLRLEACARQVLVGLSEFDVDVLLLKGAALLGDLAEPSGRGMGDVDLLIRHCDVQRTHQALTALGFSWVRHPRRFVSATLYHERHYVRGSMELVDVHMSLDRPGRYRIPTDELFVHRVPAQWINGFRPCDEHMVIHQALHIVKDVMAARAVQIDDLTMMLTHWNLRWDFLEQTASRWHAHRALRAVFSACSQRQPNLALPSQWLGAPSIPLRPGLRQALLWRARLLGARPIRATRWGLGYVADTAWMAGQKVRRLVS